MNRSISTTLAISQSRTIQTKICFYNWGWFTYRYIISRSFLPEMPSNFSNDPFLCRNDRFLCGLESPARFCRAALTLHPACPSRVHFHVAQEVIWKNAPSGQLWLLSQHSILLLWILSDVIESWRCEGVPDVGAWWHVSCQDAGWVGGQCRVGGNVG